MSISIVAAGFIQQFAVHYIGRGYRYYVTASIPEDKAPERTDQKLIAKYDIGISKWARARREEKELANIQ